MKTISSIDIVESGRNFSLYIYLLQNVTTLLQCPMLCYANIFFSGKERVVNLRDFGNIFETAVSQFGD